MNKKIIPILIFLIVCMINLYHFTDVFGDVAIPRFKPFGNSTSFSDSTNYVVLNKGFYVRDSMKVGKYLFVGITGGGIYLDTNRMGEILYSGNAMTFTNNKENGSMEFWIGEKSSEYYWYKSEGGSGTQLMQLDTVSGLTLTNGNIQLSSALNQYKVQSDTASDYDSDDAVTINSQSGTLTTKSLTTAVGSVYTITVTNSLCVATSKVFAEVSSYGGNGVPSVYIVDPDSGSFTVTLVNIASASLNATAQINFVLFNE